MCACSLVFLHRYRAYTSEDVGEQQSSGDYGKAGMPNASYIPGGLWASKLQKLYAKTTQPSATTQQDGGERDGEDYSNSGSSCSFLVQTAFDSEPLLEYGAPATVWTRVDVASSNVTVEVLFFNKTTTRRPESMLIQFLPTPSPASATSGSSSSSSSSSSSRHHNAASASQAAAPVSVSPSGNWSVDKLGSWVPVTDVIKGGCKHLHANMEGGIRVEMPSGERMSIAALDSAIASFGNLTAYPYPIQPEPATAEYGASFVLWDNLWGVNCEQLPPEQQHSLCIAAACCCSLHAAAPVSGAF